MSWNLSVICIFCRTHLLLELKTSLDIERKIKTMELSETIFPNGVIFPKFVSPNFGGKSIEGNHIRFPNFPAFSTTLFHNKLRVLLIFLLKNCVFNLFMENGLQSISQYQHILIVRIIYLILILLICTSSVTLHTTY